MDRTESARNVARRRTAAAVTGALLSFAAALGLVAVLGPANLAGAQEVAVDGELRIVGWFASPQADCADVRSLELEYDGTGTSAALGEMTAEVWFCATAAPDTPSGFAVVEGAFTFTTDRGTLTGDIVDGYAPNPLRLVLTVTGGTGDFAGASGTLVFDAGSDWTAEGFVHEGTFTGTLTLPDRPRSADDCRGGGWRDLVDDTGEPFPNQGQCVAWAVRHT